GGGRGEVGRRESARSAGRRADHGGGGRAERPRQARRQIALRAAAGATAFLRHQLRSGNLTAEERCHAFGCGLWETGLQKLDRCGWPNQKLSRRLARYRTICAVPFVTRFGPMPIGIRRWPSRK